MNCMKLYPLYTTLLDIMREKERNDQYNIAL